MKTLTFWFTILLTLPAALTAQEVYKVEQEDGTILYTDAPVAGGEAVSLPASTANVSGAMGQPKPFSTGTSKKRTNYTVTIATPAPEATIRNNKGNLTITTAAQPGSAGGRFQLKFNGQIVQSNTTGMFRLTGVNRGAHTYSVLWLDNTGKTLASTEEQTLYLHQASALINNN
ncbi:DUF4124 domain-containing protein [Alteromonas sp. ASW11-19]|uniref:DUF4124 domain-containing protein n=1 Tax=Alteromonas salexigens TaxID=2982530 RepID=A0ABT2VQ32_9ALTE|nr:DUF4124 domain-containing protein [Alteromonas salexigens]MCU7555425.1 DUF4124 domain-containing protein [Alteromonas salexigens]